MGLALYVGWGASRFPRADASVVIDRFGQPRSRQLLEAINEIFREANAVPVDWSKETLITAGHAARNYTRQQHPELSEEALKALEWKYTFDWQ
jgi:hypothetical protein